jgi:hypothetical protein
MNAINDALRPLGAKPLTEMPFTPGRILQALGGSRHRKHLERLSIELRDLKLDFQLWHWLFKLDPFEKLGDLRAEPLAAFAVVPDCIVQDVPDLLLHGSTMRAARRSSFRSTASSKSGTMS